MLVGEGPGEHEDLRGEPFVGRAGILLDKMLRATGFSREKNVYIANMVKCRPPGNRDPAPEEVETCLFFLREQLRLIAPEYIVCLGRIAAQALIDPSFRVTAQHGQFIKKSGVMMMGTFHPAALLRDDNRKPEAFDDFCKLRDRVLAG
jgi:DNA polymerase